MELILKEIERALDAKLYYLALQASLTLPDICGALQSDNGKATRDKYIAWYDTYAKEPGNLSISGKDCYYFRCSYVHQALTTHEKSSYSRIIFLAPTCHGIIMHNNVINDALNIDVKLFCNNILNAVRKWQKSIKNNENYKRNYKNLIKLYPDGFPPYITGIPVIS